MVPKCQPAATAANLAHARFLAIANFVGAPNPSEFPCPVRMQPEATCRRQMEARAAENNALGDSGLGRASGRERGLGESV